MKLPAVTVLIDTYNYGKFIEQAIDSVLLQDFPKEDMEVLVVDDGSTDDTAERVKKYGARIQYFQKPNGGQASAFNFGFAKARGAIIALLDADDYWLPGKLRRIVDEFQNHPEVGMIYHQLIQMNSSAGTLEKKEFIPRSGYLPDKPDELFWYFPYPSSFTAFRRDVLQKLPPIPEGLRIQADGYPILLSLFLAATLAIPEALAVYRVHGKNLFFGDDASLPPEQKRRRLETRQILIAAISSWIVQHGFDVSKPGVRPFLERWRLYQESESFHLEPPGRLRFFRHLMSYVRCYGTYMSSRLRVINYVNACGSLVVGYKHFHLLDKWRMQLVGKLGMRQP